MPGVTVDGNAFSAVTEAVGRAVGRARDGSGPSLVENLTYRWRGHSKSDRNRYRTKEEIAEWMARDPIPRFAETLIAHGIMTAPEVAAMEAEVDQTIAAAIEAANASADPDVLEATRDVYTPHNGAAA